MSMTARNLLLAVFGFSILAIGYAGSASAQSAEENAIKYRKSVMKALAGHMGATSSIVGGKAGEASHLPAHVAALSDLARMTRDVFPEGSDFGETTALPKIWQDKAGFAKEMDSFEAAVAGLAKAAGGGDMAATGKALGGVGKTCKSCHENYREKKKKK